MTALIIGAGSGLSTALARALAASGRPVALAARDVAKLATLARETGATTHACDASDPAQVERLFAAIDDPEIVIYNPSFRVRGPIVDLDPVAVQRTLQVCAYGGFLVAQQAARRMLKRGSGTIIFTGASASVKGYARSAPFAMGKFALRGLAQSLARELAPGNIHVAHVVIDGVIASATRTPPADKPDSLLDPVAIARGYMALIDQPRSAWTWEIEVRPWTESF